jgi:ABC-2 type transport system permease protein
LLIGLSAGDESRGLVEQQLSLPVSRTGVLLQKIAAALVVIVVATFGAAVGILLSLLFLHERESFGLILEYTLSCAALSFVYGLVGFFVASLTGRHGLAIGVASAFAFLSYLINSLAPAVSSLEAVDKLTFFHLYQLNPFSWDRFIGLLATAAVLTILSVLAFNRRDIRQN